MNGDRMFAWLFGTLMLVLVILLVWSIRAAGGATGNYWDRLAFCETHGRWSQRGRTYVGGLGIYHRNWERWAPRVGVNKPAHLASREEQIRVAKYGRRVDGATWGCFKVVGLPW